MIKSHVVVVGCMLCNKANIHVEALFGIISRSTMIHKF